MPSFRTGPVYAEARAGRGSSRPRPGRERSCSSSSVRSGKRRITPTRAELARLCPPPEDPDRRGEVSSFLPPRVAVQVTKTCHGRTVAGGTAEQEWQATPLVRLFDEPARRLCLRGDSASGKTTFLYW